MTVRTMSLYLYGMKQTLQVINQLRRRGVITNYAIGGGIAAIFYSEPILTYDLDIFVIMPDASKKKGIIQLSSIYDYLVAKGYTWKGEHIIIEGVPVQFIPADALESEAVQHAIDVRYEGARTRILTVEYLIAVLVRAGRDKDIEKIKMLIDQADVSLKKLTRILTKQKLRGKFDHILRGPSRK